MMRQTLRRTFWSVYGRFVWEKHHPPWKQAQIKRVVNALKQQTHSKGERVLDAGCGTGEYTAALADAGFTAVGVDYALGMLRHAEKKVALSRRKQLSFQQTDLDTRLPFDDDSFDHIINISVLQTTANPHFVLNELLRVARPGGTLFLLHVPRPDSHDLPLRENIRRRISTTESVRTIDKALIAFKVWGEWTGKGRYWTLDEVKTMVEEAGFEIFEEEAKPVIILHARKPRIDKIS